MMRVSVVGNSGSGKSTLGRALAARLGVPYVELDAVYHQQDWQPLPAAEFLSRVDAITTTDRWVVDGNYSAVRDLVWARADIVVVIDLPRHVVMRQVIWRTVRWAAFRVELWNGNRERWRNHSAVGMPGGVANAGVLPRPNCRSPASTAAARAERRSVFNGESSGMRPRDAVVPESLDSQIDLDLTVLKIFVNNYESRMFD